MKIKNLLYRVFAIFFALWIFLISTGIVVDLHYCQGKIKHFAVFSKAKSCHSGNEVCPMHKKSCDNKSFCKMHKAGDNEDNCCHNEKKIVKLPVKYTFDKPAISKTFDFAATESNFVVKTCNYNFQYDCKNIFVERPPPLKVDFQALFQSYLL